MFRCIRAKNRIGLKALPSPSPSPADFRRNKETDFIAINFTVDAYRSYSFRFVDFSSVAIHSFAKFNCIFFYHFIHTKKCTNPKDYIQIKEHTEFIAGNEQQIYFFAMKLMRRHSHTHTPHTYNSLTQYFDCFEYIFMYTVAIQIGRII